MRQFLVGMQNGVHAAIHHFIAQASKAQTVVKCRHAMVPADIAASLAEDPLILTSARCNNVHALKGRFDLGQDDSLVFVVAGNITDDAGDEYFIAHGLERGAAYPGVALISLYFLNSESEFMLHRAQWWNLLSDRQRKKRVADIILLNLLATFAYDVAELRYHEETNGCVMDFCQTTSDILSALSSGFRFCDEYCLEWLRSQSN